MTAWTSRPALPHEIELVREHEHRSFLRSLTPEERKIYKRAVDKAYSRAYRQAHKQREAELRAALADLVASLRQALARYDSTWRDTAKDDKLNAELAAILAEEAEGSFSFEVIDGVLTRKGGGA